MNRTAFFVIANSVVASLVGCGGGGGDSSSTATPPVAVPGGDSTLVTTITTPVYSVGTEELAAFNLMNAERQRCGFGMLQQNAQLDHAALAHANWQISNNAYTHAETVGSTGFTGATPTDRATAAGYQPYGSVAESLAYGTSASKSGRGEAGVRELFVAPYHAATMLSPARDVGISVRSPIDLGLSSLIPVTQINLGTSTNYQLLASDEVATYPCENTAGVNYRLTNESPNPVPGRNLMTQPLGHPVMLMVRRGNTLVISSASMSKLSNGRSVALRAPITGTNDPNNVLLGNEGYIIADSALEASTSYAVTVTGTNNGIPFNKSFSFTTGIGG